METYRTVTPRRWTRQGTGKVEENYAEEVDESWHGKSKGKLCQGGGLGRAIEKYNKIILRRWTKHSEGK